MWPLAAALVCGVVDQADGPTVRIEPPSGPTLWLEGPALAVRDGETLCVVRVDARPHEPVAAPASPAPPKPPPEEPARGAAPTSTSRGTR